VEFLMNRIVFGALAISLATLCDFRISIADEPAKPVKTAEFNEVPIAITVKQRATERVPGSKDDLKITLDDITSGQVMVSVTKTKGEVVLPATSLRSGETKLFKLGKREYQLRVKQLHNALIGNDWGEFEIGLAPDGKSEPEKIESLLLSLQSLDGAVFIRNEKEYSIAETIEHLRTKWKGSADEVTTAEQFIEHVASKSSVSGKPYVIRRADKTVVPAGVYLKAQLREIEKRK